MRRLLCRLSLAVLTVLVFPALAAASVVINELDSDQAGTDAAEFVELFDGGAGNTSLTGMVVVFYNGSNDLSYAAFDLDGYSTDASGYFVLGNTGVPGVDLVFAGNFLQNGQDAVALYNGDATSFPNGTAVTTTNLVDALVYDTSDADDPGLLVLLNAGQPQVDENANAASATESIGRCPNGSGGTRNTSSYAAGSPTANAANNCAAPPVAHAIHEIQGSGASSPFVATAVETTGIVTGVKTTGFYLQAPDASADADPTTSEGVFVFTSSAPTVAVGDSVTVTGTVSEYIPTADTQQPPLTEIGAPQLSVTLNSSGNPLPAAISLTTTLPDPAGAHDQLERYEGMLVTVPSLTVVAPTLGSVDEPTATATSTGVLYGVVTGVARPLREAGVQLPDALPAGSPANVPRFDTNPETLRVDSDGVGHALLDVNTGTVLSGINGPLTYGFRHYTIEIAASATVGASGGVTPVAVTTPTSAEFTIGSYNLERFFDTTDDPAISEPVLSAAAFEARLVKASRGIREILRTPDILGVAECENLATLSTLAARLNADAVAAGQPDPQYAAYLMEGHDVGGIDVGFLVKTAPVAGSVARVEALSVAQEGFNTLFVSPDSSTAFLNDRPTLRLQAIVSFVNGKRFPVTVMVNHLRSLGSVNSEAAGSNGWTTEGQRVRAKRLQQAEEVATVVQARQAADPNEWIVLVGDFNAFDVNDGFVDSIGTILGAPAPDDQSVVPGDGIDLVTPNLVRLGAGTYSYTFDGAAQSLDHVLVDAAAVSGTVARRLEPGHVNADFAETVRNDGSSVARLSDHDPLLAYFQPVGVDATSLLRDGFESGDRRWWTPSAP